MSPVAFHIFDVRFIGLLVMGIGLSVTPAVVAGDVNLPGQQCVFLNQNDWRNCQQVSDCVVVFDACGWLTAINHRYVQEHDQYNRCVGPMISCVAPDKDQKLDGKFKAACEHDQCQLVKQ